MALPFPQSTISTGCQVDTGDGPGGVGSRFFGPGEDVLSRALNRAPWALVQNDEYLDNIVSTEEKAYTEVAVLSSFSGGSIGVDPSGGAAGDVNYTGTLYLGEPSWSGAGRDQEFLDTLFQVLDEDYNEVLVDGEEVKVTSLAGNALGDEFVSTLTTLTLNKTLPSGNYRLAYGRGSSYVNLPAYAFMRADVHGLQEAPGEAGRRGFYVLDPSSTPAFPADFKGPTCIQDAIAALGAGTVLFLRSGSYTVHAAGASGTALTLSDANITIIGEGRDAVTLNLQTGHDLNISGAADNFELCDVTVSSPDSDKEIIVQGSNCALRRVRTTTVGLNVSSGIPLDLHFLGENLSIQGGDGLYVNNIKFATFDNCFFTQVGSSSVGAVRIGACSYITFRDCRISSGPLTNNNAIEMDNSRKLSFTDCYVTAEGTGWALSYGDISAANSIESTFKSCVFESEATIVSPNVATFEAACGLRFIDCRFENTASALYNGSILTLAAQGGLGGFDAGFGIYLENCRIYDEYNQLLDPSGSVGRAAIIMTNVRAKGLVIDRSNGTQINWDNALLYTDGDSHLEDVLLIDNQSNVVASVVGGDFLGRVTVRGRASITNMRVEGIQETHRRPLFYLEGSTQWDGLPGSNNDKVHVDKVDLIPAYPMGTAGTGQRWGLSSSVTDQGLIATLANSAVLSRLNFPQDCSLTDSDAGGDNNTSLCLVFMEGERSELRRCSLRKWIGSLEAMVMSVATWGRYHKIIDNEIYAGQVGGVNDVQNCVYIDGPTNPNRDGHCCRNEITWLGEVYEYTNQSGAPPAWYGPVVAFGARNWLFNENIILAWEETASLPGVDPLAIIFVWASDVSAGYTNNGNQCIGNNFRLVNAPNSKPMKVYYPVNIPAGDTTNHSVYGGSA